MKNLQPSNSVLTIGEPVISFVPDSTGVLSLTHRFRPYVGGAELNTAIGLARLGVKTSYASAVGSDPFGDMIFRALRSEGVDTLHLQHSKSSSTGILFKEWTGLEQETSVLYYRDKTPVVLEEFDMEDLFSKIQAGMWNWLHMTGITFMRWYKTDQLFQFLKAARGSNTTISFDVNLRLKLGGVAQWRERVEAIIPYVDWFLAGDDEATVLLGMDSAVEIERYLRSLGFNGLGVIIKRGTDGAECSCKGVNRKVEAWKVRRVVDTVGAGDGFNAGWIAYMLSNSSLKDALRAGCLVGAHAVTSQGDFDGYPTLEEVVRQLEGKAGVLR